MYLTLFGTATGFSARTYGRPPFEVDDRWIDSRNGVALEEPDWAAVVSRQHCAQGLLTWIGLYRPAHEIHVSRGGQYGAGLWLLNQAAPGVQAFALLTAVADEVARLALVNGKFTRNFDAFESEIQWPEELGASVRKALRPVTQGGLGVGDKPMLLMDASAPDDTAACGLLIDIAQSGFGLGNYQRMVITDRPRVVRQSRALTHASSITPARWQQDSEGLIEQTLKRIQSDLQTALADANVARKEVAALHERLSADHTRAMAEQSACLTADFDQKMQQASAKIATLEPALQSAQSELASVILRAQATEESNVVLQLVVRELRADARNGFVAAHAKALAEHLEKTQTLEARLKSVSAALEDTKQKLGATAQECQLQSSEVTRLRQQNEASAEAYSNSLSNVRQDLNASIAALAAERDKANDLLGSANSEIKLLAQDKANLRAKLQEKESSAAAVLASGQVPEHAKHDGDSAGGRRPWMVTLGAHFRPLLKPVVIPLVLLALLVSVHWMRAPVAPQATEPEPVAGNASAVPTSMCAEAWQVASATFGPTIAAPSTLPRATVAEAIWQAACSSARPPACRDHDQREIARRLDAGVQSSNPARSTYLISLAQACQLPTDSTLEWTDGNLMRLPPATYLDPPPGRNKKPAEPSLAIDKKAKAGDARAAGGASRPAAAKASAAGAAASTRAASGGSSQAPSAPAKSEARSDAASERPRGPGTPAVPGGGTFDPGP